MLVRQLLKESKVFSSKDAAGSFTQDRFVDVVSEAVAKSIDLHLPVPGATATAPHAAPPSTLRPLVKPHFEGASHEGGGIDSLDDVAEHGRVSSRFGVRTDPFTHKHAFHHGVDVAAPRGSEIVALAGGTVTVAGPAAGYGNLVEVEDDAGRRVRYGHADSVSVKVGDIVERGQALATVGSTGRSTGPHVHVEVRDEDGDAIDPETALLLVRSAPKAPRGGS